MTIRKVLIVGMLLGVLSACSAPHPDLKSPCVGNDGSPCARRPVNDWWLNPSDES